MAARRLLLAALLIPAVLAGALLTTSPPAYAAAPAGGWEPPPDAEELTGPCLPRLPRTVVRHDLLALALERCPLPPAQMRYNRFDPTGAVTQPGQYTFLMPGDDGERVVTSYAQLRTDATRFRLNTSDRTDTSQADFYDLVEVNDIVEWRRSDTCWARYRVMDMPEPAEGAVQREFGIHWVSYTYDGCPGSSGVPTQTAVDLEWTPPDFAWDSVTSITWHGPFNITPRNYRGPPYPVKPTSAHGPPPLIQGAAADPRWPSNDIAVVRTHPLWREADLPDAWRIGMLQAFAEGNVISVVYGDGAGYLAMEIHIVRNNGRHIPVEASPGRSFVLIDGHPAVIMDHGGIIDLFDETTGVEYIVYAHDPAFVGNAEANIAVMRSLLAGSGTP